MRCTLNFPSPLSKVFSILDLDWEELSLKLLFWEICQPFYWPELTASTAGHPHGGHAPVCADLVTSTQLEIQRIPHPRLKSVVQCYIPLKEKWSETEVVLRIGYPGTTRNDNSWATAVMYFCVPLCIRQCLAPMLSPNYSLPFPMSLFPTSHRYLVSILVTPMIIVLPLIMTQIHCTHR